ncbi:hypothetical protein M8997_013795 [Phyllobacterium sp. 21LDTY02-6]|uniref:hypothetical protein n=1 Tax=unclassified Phyllobacterium TaxID=2638441 RepID=UPI0020217D35|nr:MULTISPECIES: hypothetical protein [unclassified Phyllobacterium]MCO4318263.1 hypothetical protein [Phyllobacterium sp. 21LDTY02-6]MCX8280258.1 hypothetical protein [Phyllobacterium sp. 0TCS1.6C]MCX8294181.1 hypothetical protein [Phyllobacterium sp. 0TCS1.6A]
MVQLINNVGSQQALENNWNDENAMRKFERAAGGAVRSPKDATLAKKQRPSSVELRAGTGLSHRKNLLQDEIDEETDEPLATGPQPRPIRVNLVGVEPLPQAAPAWRGARVTLVVALVAAAAICGYFLLA